MKKILLALLIVAVVGCNRKRPFLKYILTINGDNSNISGKYLIPNETIEEDTILALNDTAAYSQAVKKWYSRLLAENLIKHVSTSRTFKIIDTNNIDLNIKLNRKVKDSINNQYLKFYKKEILRLKTK